MITFCVVCGVSLDTPEEAEKKLHVYCEVGVDK